MPSRTRMMPRAVSSYGVPVTFGYASRQTFVIGRDGKIAKIFRSVSVQGHSAEVLESVK